MNPDLKTRLDRYCAGQPPDSDLVKLLLEARDALQRRPAATPFYEIVHGIPRVGELGFGFQIRVWPAWREVVAAYSPTPGAQRAWLHHVGNDLLDACGYGEPFQSFQSVAEELMGITPSSLIPAPTERLYDATRGAITFQWGAWGLEHITIPGNGCGLDIDETVALKPDGGVVLLTHNVDTMQQSYLLQCIYGWFAHTMLLAWTTRDL